MSLTSTGYALTFARRNWWPGKSRDLRKHGADAFPFEGAADMESHVIDERITKLVSLFMSSLRRANVSAYPVEVSDIGRSKLVSSFMKWMVSSGYIPWFYKEMELGANYLLERGILVTYVGWHREDRRFIQKLDLNQISEISLELASAIIDERKEDDVIELLKTTFDGVTDAKAKKAIRQLRKNGEAELPVYEDRLLLRM